MIKVVDTTIGHLIEFRKNVRTMDLEEIRVASGKSFDDHSLTILYGCKTLIDSNGVVLGIGGVEDHIVWLVCTKAVESRKVEFLRFSKRYYTELLERHGYLGNAVYIKNQLHIDYLNWLGVTWLGTEGELMAFIIERKEESECVGQQHPQVYK